MGNRNIVMKAGIRELGKDFCKSLGEEIEALCNADPKMQDNRRPLYFQVEPFFMEFKDTPRANVIERENYDEYADWINRRLQGVKNQGLKVLRASFFGWLSYYHPKKAQALLDRYKVSVPLYDGHPDLRSCSDEAKAQFKRQERNEGSLTATAAVRENPDGASELEQLPEEPLPKAQQDDSETGSEPEQTEPRKRRALVLTVAALALLGFGGFAVWNSDLLGGLASEEQIAPQLASGELGPSDGDLSQTPSTEPDEADDDPAAEAEQDKEEQEASVEPAPPSPTPVPQRTVNPVWNNITGFAWSTKELNYFYPTLQSANRADLLEAARQGNTAAQTLAAVGYHSGRLGRTDHGLEIRDYLRPACANGQGRACTLLGVHYRAGWGVPRSNATAAEFYSKGCRLGNLTGCHYEGVRYLNGEGVARDVPRAIATFTNACELGVGYSCYLLSGIYGQGVGVEQDLERARQYQERYQRLSS